MNGTSQNGLIVNGSLQMWIRSPGVSITSSLPGCHAHAATLSSRSTLGNLSVSMGTHRGLAPCPCSASSGVSVTDGDAWHPTIGGRKNQKEQHMLRRLLSLLRDWFPVSRRKGRCYKCRNRVSNEVRYLYSGSIGHAQAVLRSSGCYCDSCRIWFCGICSYKKGRGFGFIQRGEQSCLACPNCHKELPVKVDTSAIDHPYT